MFTENRNGARATFVVRGVYKTLSNIYGVKHDGAILQSHKNVSGGGVLFTKVYNCTLFPKI